MGQRLSNTPALELDEFIEDYLQPNTSFCDEVRAVTDVMGDILKERCFRDAAYPVRVSKVVKGGSSGKGTALKDEFKADLVVFLTNLTSFEDQLKQRREILKEIEKQLCQLKREKVFPVQFGVLRSWGKNSPELILRLRCPQLQQEVEFDVLPDYDVLGSVCFYSKPDPEIYRKLISECTSLRKEGEFSTCFTELQHNFLKHHSPKLKSLICLVKHWYQLCKEKLGELLPPQYALELLTVYAWQRGSGDTEFHTAQGFRTALQLVTNHRQLRIYWTVYYDFEDQDISNYLHSQLRRARPVILDPADPTRNVAAGNPEAWCLLTREAKDWLKCLCCRNYDMSLVHSWNVQVEVEEPQE